MTEDCKLIYNGRHHIYSLRLPSHGQRVRPTTLPYSPPLHPSILPSPSLPPHSLPPSLPPSLFFIPSSILPSLCSELSHDHCTAGLTDVDYTWTECYLHCHCHGQQPHVPVAEEWNKYRWSYLHQVHDSSGCRE